MVGIGKLFIFWAGIGQLFIFRKNSNTIYGPTIFFQSLVLREMVFLKLTVVLNSISAFV